MKHCLYIHQDYQPQNFLYVRWMKYLVNRPIFHKFYMQSAIIKPCRMYFKRNFQLTACSCSWHMVSFTNNFPKNFNWVSSRLLFCNVLRFERTRCFSFLHLNFMITRFFFPMRWQACRSSNSTVITVSDSAWDFSEIPIRDFRRDSLCFIYFDVIIRQRMKKKFKLVKLFFHLHRWSKNMWSCAVTDTGHAQRCYLTITQLSVA